MTGKRILVVEDDAVTAQFGKTILKRPGCEVCNIVASGEEAVRRAEELRPDLVFMDIRLEGEMDGIQAAREIQRRIPLPVIYVSSHSDRAMLERAGHTNHYGFVVKPYDEKELEASLEAAFTRLEMEKNPGHHREAHAGRISHQNIYALPGLIVLHREWIITGPAALSSAHGIPQFRTAPHLCPKDSDGIF